MCYPWPTCRIDADGCCLTCHKKRQRSADSASRNNLSYLLARGASSRDHALIVGLMDYRLQRRGPRPGMTQQTTNRDERGACLKAMRVVWSLTFERRLRSTGVYRLNIDGRQPRGRPADTRPRESAHIRRGSSGERRPMVGAARCNSIFQVNTRAFTVVPPSVRLLDQLTTALSLHVR